MILIGWVGQQNSTLKKLIHKKSITYIIHQQYRVVKYPQKTDTHLKKLIHKKSITYIIHQQYRVVKYPQKTDTHLKKLIC